jgi:hypothetical protein
MVTHVKKWLSTAVLLLALFGFVTSCSDDVDDLAEVSTPKTLQKTTKSLLSSDGDMTQEYVRVQIKGGSTSVSDSENIFKYSYDGDLRTFYNSDSYGIVPFPVTLTYDFENVSSIDQITYYPLKFLKVV